MAASAHSCVIDTLPSSILATILAQLSSTQAQLGAARTCRSWRALCLRLYSEKGFALRAFVTLAAENRVVVLDGHGQTVQDFEPMPARCHSRRGHHRAARGHWRACKHLYRWPTCLALGPEPGSLYVSQYRVRGVLRYDTDPTGTTYHYTRVAASDKALESPEGIVANMDSSLFVVSAAHGTVNHVSAQGTLLRTWSCSAWTRDRGSTGTFRVPWGMCRGPDRALYVAVHTSDGGDYTEPTPRATGDILRLELDAEDFDGADPLRLSLVAQEFQPRLLCGTHWQMQERPSQLNANVVAEVIRQEFEWERAANPGLGLNRPSNPCFWQLPSPCTGQEGAPCRLSDDDDRGELETLLLVSSFCHPEQEKPWSSSDSIGAASSAALAQQEKLEDELETQTGRNRGIAIFSACGCKGQDTPTTTSLSERGVAADLSTAAAAEGWRPWGLCAFGERIFATGHAGGALAEESISQDAGLPRLVDQREPRTGTAAKANEREGAEGCVKVWEGGRWLMLRAALREPNYILVC
eukprot:COSAG02_NODE_9697_length_2138_cov_2.323198_2_plen_524_part_00